MEGLRLMRELGGQIDLPIHVYGPETHMTAIVAMSLGQEPVEDPKPTEVSTGNFLLPSMVSFRYYRGICELIALRYSDFLLALSSFTTFLFARQHSMLITIIQTCEMNFHSIVNLNLNSDQQLFQILATMYNASQKHESTFTPYVWSERIFDSRPFIYNKTFLKKIL